MSSGRSDEESCETSGSDGAEDKVGKPLQGGLDCETDGPDVFMPRRMMSTCSANYSPFELGSAFFALSSVVFVLFDSSPYFYDWRHASESTWIAFKVLDILFGICFLIEYYLRATRAASLKAYAFSFFGIVDAVVCFAIFYDIAVLIRHVNNNYAEQNNYRSFAGKLLWFLRVIRVLKLLRIVREMRIIEAAVAKEMRAMGVFVLCVLIFVLLVGTGMYCIENGKNGFDCIPISCWWAIVTLTTVGFGDMVPGTALGRCIAAAVMLLGYSILAVPTITGVLGSNQLDSDPVKTKPSHRSITDAGRRGAHLGTKEGNLDHFRRTCFWFFSKQTSRPSDFGPNGFLHAATFLQFAETAISNLTTQARELAYAPGDAVVIASSFEVLEPLKAGHGVDVGISVEGYDSSTCVYRVGFFEAGCLQPSAVGYLRHAWYSGSIQVAFPRCIIDSHLKLRIKCCTPGLEVETPRTTRFVLDVSPAARSLP